MRYNSMDDLLHDSLRVPAAAPPTLTLRTRQAVEALAAQPAPAGDTVARPARRRAIAWRSLFAAALLVALCATTVMGLSHLLAGREVAQLAGNDALAQAFEIHSLPVYAVREAGGYLFTLTEITRGSDITSLPLQEAAIAPGRMYTVLAIQHSDGTPITQGGMAYFASPLVEGYSPAEINIHTLRAASQDVLHEGILYRLIECDDVAVFADHDLYLLAGTGGTLFEAVSYDEATGHFAIDPAFGGVATLFTLPIPAQYADPAAAGDLLEGIANPTNNAGAEMPRLANLEAARDPALWEGVESIFRQALTTDDTGFLQFAYLNIDEDAGAMRYGILASAFYEMLEEQGANSLIVSVFDGGAYLQALRFTLEADGTLYGEVLQMPSPG